MYKKVSAIWNQIEHFLFLASAITWFVSLSDFASLLGTPIGITSFSIGLQMFALSVGIKKYDSVIKKKEKKHDKILSLANLT